MNIKNIVVFILIAAFSIQSQIVKNSVFPNSYLDIYNQIINSKNSYYYKCAEIDNLVLVRDVAKFHLKNGKLFLLPPISDQIIFAVYVGGGEFAFKPQNKIEQDQLYRFLNKRELNEKIENIFFVFFDHSIEDLEKKLKFSKPSSEDHISRCIKDGLELLSDEDSRYFNTSVMKNIMDRSRNELFYAFVEFEDMEHLLFKIDPYDIEEISLSRKAKNSILYDYPEVICQFQKQQDYNLNRNSIEENKDVLSIDHYKITSAIESNMDFNAETEITFSLINPGQKWIYFYLYHDLEVDSMFWQNGEKATFFRYEDNPYVWIQLDNTVSTKNEIKLLMYYHGDLIIREKDWFNIKSSIGWYPRYGGRNLNAIFDLTFNTPEDMIFVAVGDLISTSENEDYQITRWLTNKPIRNASFNIGYFEEYEIKDPRVPPIVVYIEKFGHIEIEHYLAERGILSGSDMEKEIAADVANSISFYQKVFGYAPVSKFYATEIPGSHGEAFPGLIHLSWATFQRTDESGWDEVFRAHEVAHQWWGIGVDFETYHDQWLSEGLSTFAGLWYMQTVLNDNEKYFGLLENWQEAIQSNRQYLFSSGQESGPIWLGYRTNSSTTEGDFNLIIYKKGAWIFHMLRNMMLDLKTMKEDRFSNMMRDFYNSNIGTTVTTAEFQQCVEKHMNQKMDWFFKQWIYDTDIPTYDFSYNIVGGKGNKYLLQCKVIQSNVDDNFQMLVPIKIEFSDDRFVRFRVLIDKPVSEFTIPDLPFKPEDVIFNDLKSVLCEVDYDSWEE